MLPKLALRRSLGEEEYVKGNVTSMGDALEETPGSPSPMSLFALQLSAEVPGHGNLCLPDSGGTSPLSMRRHAETSFRC